MIIRLFFNLIFCSSIGTLVAQTSFYKVYSGNGYDKGEGIAQLPDSSFLITGSSSSFEEAPSQVFLMHIDSTGQFLWSKSYGGPEFEEGKRVMAVPGFGYYIAGTSTSGTSGAFDAYLIFTDELGNKLWEKYTDNGGWERVNDAILMPDTSVIIVGETDANNTSSQDIFYARYNKMGTLMWSKQISTAGNDVAHTVYKNSDTTFLMGGTFYVADSLLNKAFLTSIDYETGDTVWFKTYGNIGDYQINDAIIVGTEIKAVGQLIKTGKTDFDEFVLQTNLDGTFVYSQELYQNYDSRISNLLQYEGTGLGKYFMSNQQNNPTFPTYENGEDTYIIRMDPGIYFDYYSSGYSNVGQDQINQLINTSDKYGAAVGFITGYGPGGNSVTVVKIGDDNAFPSNSPNPAVINIVHVPSIESIPNLSVYPNPVVDNLTIEIPNESFEYLVLDATGKQLIKQVGFGTIDCDFSSFSTGFYLIQVNLNGQSSTIRIVK